MKSTKKKIKSYRKSYKKYGIDPRALQWLSKKAQEVRFRELIADIDFEKKSVLDVGCGFGDIIPFISEKTKSFEYKGIDLMPEFIEVAKARYKTRKFVVGDYFGNPSKEKYDIILTSGTLNANIEDAVEFRKKAIKTMFGHAKEVVAFNMAGGHPQPENKKNNKVYYADSQEILKFCFSLTNKLIFRDRYRKQDFTIVMFKI